MEEENISSNLIGVDNHLTASSMVSHDVQETPAGSPLAGAKSFQDSESRQHKHLINDFKRVIFVMRRTLLFLNHHCMQLLKDFSRMCMYTALFPLHFHQLIKHHYSFIYGVA